MIGKIFRGIDGTQLKPALFGKAFIDDSEIRSFGTLNIISDVQIQMQPGVRFYVWVDGKAADQLWPIQDAQAIHSGEDQVKQEGMFRYKLSMGKLPEE